MRLQTSFNYSLKATPHSARDEVVRLSQSGRELEESCVPMSKACAENLNLVYRPFSG